MSPGGRTGKYKNTNLIEPETLEDGSLWYLLLNIKLVHKKSFNYKHTQNGNHSKEHNYLWLQDKNLKKVDLKSKLCLTM